MVCQIYPSEPQLNEAIASVTKAAFLDGDVPRSTSYGVYISKRVRFARASGHVADFNICNKC